MEFLFELIADIVFEAAADQILDKKTNHKGKDYLRIDCTYSDAADYWRNTLFCI